MYLLFINDKITPKRALQVENVVGMFSQAARACEIQGLAPAIEPPLFKAIQLPSVSRLAKIEILSMSDSEPFLDVNSKSEVIYSRKETEFRCVLSNRVTT